MQFYTSTTVLDQNEIEPFFWHNFNVVENTVEKKVFYFPGKKFAMNQPG